MQIASGMAKVTRLSFDQSSGANRRRLHLREISAEADMPLETVGHDLRTARQRKGEDLAAASRVLKIRKDHLEALEESNFERLPGRAYALGFIRSYAVYLGLDAAQCVERYKAEIAGLGEPEEAPEPNDAEIERSLPQGGILLIVLILIAVAIGGYYLSVSAERMLAELDTPAAQAPDESAAPAIPEPSPPVPAVPAPPPEPAAAEQAVTLPPGRAYGTQNTNSRVTLRVHNVTRVLVQGADNMVYLNRALQPGDLYQAPNLVGLAVTTPDSGAVEIILDGVSVGFLGLRGAIAEGLSLNPQDIVDRAQQTPG